MRRTRILMVLLLWLIAASLMTDSICVYKATSGLPCPGCGMTRALTALIHGDYGLAFYMHPLWPLVILGIVIGVWLLVTRQTERFKHFSMSRQGNRLWLALLLIVVLVYVFRMLQYFPHTEPMSFNAKALLPQMYKIFIIR